MSVFSEAVQLGWLLLPAAAANMAPVIAAHWRLWPRLAQPIDRAFVAEVGYIFGPHKTWRGLVVGVCSGSIVAALQFVFLEYSQGLAFVPASSVFGAVLWGVWLSMGALGGDLLKSFVKRRVGHAAGASWMPFDQADWSLGALLCAALVIDVHVVPTSFAVIVLSGATWCVSFFAHALHIKKNI